MTRRTDRAGVLALLTAVVVAAVAGAALLVASTGGPATNTKLAERSLLAAFDRAYPSRAPARVHCDGLRDGANVFACTVSRAGHALTSYGVLYDDDAKAYAADGSAGAYRRLRYRPVR